MTETPVTPKGYDLEEQFFRKRNEELLQQMRARVATENQTSALQAVLGISDQAIVQRLVALGVTAESAAALSLVPLIHVAWCDGSLEDAERDAVLRAARGAGLEADQPGYHLLEDWLQHRPEPKLVESWQAYVRSLVPQLSAEDREKLKSQTVGRAGQVAEAAGGFLGMNKISQTEKNALAQLERAFG